MFIKYLFFEDESDFKSSIPGKIKRIESQPWVEFDESRKVFQISRQIFEDVSFVKFQIGSQIV